MKPETHSQRINKLLEEGGTVKFPYDAMFLGHNPGTLIPNGGIDAPATQTEVAGVKSAATSGGQQYVSGDVQPI